MRHRQEFSKIVTEREHAALESELEAQGYRVSGEATRPGGQTEVFYERSPQRYYCGICGWVDISRFPNCH